MTHTQWADGIAVKVSGTLNLVDALSTPSPSTASPFTPDTCALIFFILLGNTFQGAIARHHANKGHPFRAIDVGMVAEVGSTAENKAAARFASAQGHRWHGVAQFLAALDFAIAHPGVGGADRAQVMLGARRADPNSASGSVDGGGQRGARFSHIWSVSSQEEPAIEATTCLGLKTKVARLLDIAVSEIQPDQPVVSYGVDSLIELQLRYWISGGLGGQVTTLELMSSMSVVQLTAVFAGDGRE
ncbi:hypothetical protein BDV19DRAFT_395419 [Aspergillus venezuelensis]